MSTRLPKCHSMHTVVADKPLPPPFISLAELGQAQDTTAFAWGALLPAPWWNSSWYIVAPFLSYLTSHLDAARDTVEFTFNQVSGKLSRKATSNIYLEWHTLHLCSSVNLTNSVGKNYYESFFISCYILNNSIFTRNVNGEIRNLYKLKSQKYLSIFFNINIFCHQDRHPLLHTLSYTIKKEEGT